MYLRCLFLACVSVFFELQTAHSEAQDSILSDRNGNGKISLTCFGDSITFGVGDNGLLPDAAQKGGWPNLAETLLGVLFDNKGVPGEMLTQEGYLRFPQTILQSDTDFVVIFEGANDAYRSINPSVYKASLQRIINVAQALDKLPVLVTLPTPCCEHLAQALATDLYSSEITLAGAANNLVVVDVKRAWETTCQNRSECELYNLPEGLHPTSKGYEVISQVMAAALLGIDIFATDGAASLESALGLAPGTVIVKPEVVATGV